MNPIFLGGAVGVALMYFLDPNLGRRRRARTRDKVVHAARVVNEGAKVTARDTVHRVQGAWAEARKIFEPEDVTDEVLIGRVRAELGRVVSHPHAIEVAASGGHRYRCRHNAASFLHRDLCRPARAVAAVD